MTARPRRGPLPRVAALVAALALTATVLSVVPAAAAPEPLDPAAAALLALQADAEGELALDRTPDGTLEAVTSRDGTAILETDADSPADAARESLEDYGAAFGLDGETSRAVLGRSLSSATGGTVVRAEQRVDGVPVFGAQVVLTLDRSDDVVSLDADTLRAGPEVEVPAARVDRGEAVRLAVQGARAGDDIDDSDEAEVTGSVVRRWLYDPELVGVDDPVGVRPVWEVALRGPGVRQTVLVETADGDVALRFDSAPHALRRYVCDNDSVLRTTPTVCQTPARDDTSGASADGEVEAAYTHLGRTAAAYDQLAGIDLTETIGSTARGTGTTSQRRLVATVDWCEFGSCRFQNAFWDPGTRQAVFGRGFARADDVVAHELTHGYVRATAGLLYLHQSGAIDESLADTLGEIVDHRNGSDDDSAWTVGEDLGAFPDPPVSIVRSMADPTADDMPDRMTSPHWYDEAVQPGDVNDNGGVHTNNGVGNKTAYLVSQGGSFNGRTIAGLDAGDPGLAKTGLLYLEAIPQLTPGADYADLGRVLEATCARLAAVGTGGFAAADCLSVRQAVAATELSQQPTAGPQPEQVARSCPSGTSEVTTARDDDAAQRATTPGATGLGLGYAPAALAGTVTGEYAVSGRGSVALRDPSFSADGGTTLVTATTAALRVPSGSGGSYLHFQHAYNFGTDYSQSQPSYFHGGRVEVERQVGSAWQPVDPLVWDNGPRQQVAGADSTPFTGFGGDSRGWGASQVDLTLLAGQTVRFRWVVEGGEGAAVGLGWWLDDIRLYTCASALADAPASVTTAVSGTAVRVDWTPPARRADEVTGYRVTRSDTGASATVSAAARSHTLTGFGAAADVDLSVRALGLDTVAGPPRTARVESTLATTTTSLAAARARQVFTVTGKLVERGTTRAVPGVRLTLQRRLAGSSAWTTVSSGDTSAAGTRSWQVQLAKTTSYRVVATGETRFFGTTSTLRTVRKR